MEPIEPMEEAHVAAAIDMDAEMAKLLAEINSVAEPSLRRKPERIRVGVFWMEQSEINWYKCILYSILYLEYI